MLDKCAKAVEAKIGKKLTKAETSAIEKSIRKEVVRLSLKDPEAFKNMTADERTLTAAANAMRDVVRQAELKKYRTSLQILRNAATDEYLASKGWSMSAVDNLIAFSSKEDVGVTSIEHEGNAIYQIYLSQMDSLFDVDSGRFMGFLQNADDVNQFTRAMWGETQDIKPEIVKAAKETKAVFEAVRERKNRAGGDVGDLGDDYHMPNHHSRRLIAKAGREAWIADTIGALDRRRYLNIDGRLMNDVELTQFLDKSYDSLISNGKLKADDDESGLSRRGQGGGIASRGGQSRELFFRDATSWTEYQNKYGDRDVFNIILGKIRSDARDIAVMEKLGPYARERHQYMLEKSEREAIRAGEPEYKTGAKSYLSKSLFNMVAGGDELVDAQGLARFLQQFRSYLVASRLGSALISSFSDEATMRLAGRIWDIPAMKLTRQELAQFNPANAEDRRILRRVGFYTDTLTGAMVRFGGQVNGGMASKLASSSMKLSLLPQLTDARRAAWGSSMMDVLGHMVKDMPYDKLTDLDSRLIKSKGVTAQDWAIWNKADLAPLNESGDMMGLTPQAIMAIPDADIAALIGSDNPTVIKSERDKAATRFMAIVSEEVDMAVIEPGARERNLLFAGTTSGTLSGELIRSVMQFKTFGIAMTMRHIGRGLSMREGGAAYIAALIAGTTIMGAISMEVSEILAGRDPRALWGENAGKAWIAAALKGGSFGLYGDFLYANEGRSGQGITAALMGPTVGTFDQLYNATWGNVRAGEPEDVGGDLGKMAKGFTPYASTWYAKGALDHLVFHDMQEYFSPGYLSRMRGRAKRDFAQDYWWSPGENTPERAPNIEAIGGNQ